MFFKVLWQNKIAFLVGFLVFFLGGYLFTDKVYNDLNVKYEMTVAKTDFDYEKLLTEEYYDDTLAKINAYNQEIALGNISGKKISYATIDYHNLTQKKKIMISESSNGVSISVLAKYFPTILRVSSTGEPNYGYNRFSTYYKLLLGKDYSEFDIEVVLYSDGSTVKIIDYVNPYFVGLLSGVGSLLALVILYLVLFYMKKPKEEPFVFDNENTFKTVFHLKYWQKSLREMKSVKSMTIIAMLFAAMLACKAMKLPSGFGDLGLSFTFLFFAIIALLYGPIVGLTIGICSDLLGFVLFPSSGVFNAGYTLNALLTGFAYGIAFYKTKLTFTKCLYVRIFVNLFINVFLGSIWWGMIYDFNYEQLLVYMAVISLPKNLIYLLPQSILLFAVIKALGRVFKQTGLVSEEITDHISLY